MLQTCRSISNSAVLFPTHRGIAADLPVLTPLRTFNAEAATSNGWRACRRRRAQTADYAAGLHTAIVNLVLALEVAATVVVFQISLASGTGRNTTRAGFNQHAGMRELCHPHHPAQPSASASMRVFAGEPIGFPPRAHAMGERFRVLFAATTGG